jgi:hypothetical protein
MTLAVGSASTITGGGRLRVPALAGPAVGPIRKLRASTLVSRLLLKDDYFFITIL